MYFKVLQLQEWMICNIMQNNTILHMNLMKLAYL